ncbi:MAG: PhoH family protein [Gammaproteobacteria bacterium]|nr:PhoH family protein [Gammaproteobacteria bacterium]
MIRKKIRGKRLFVLDTNVLMHDPTALFRFDEHDVFLPMIVLEELDAGKKGMSEVSRNVRQTSRFLDDLMGNASSEEVHAGVSLLLPPYTSTLTKKDVGRLFFQTREYAVNLPVHLPGRPDNSILAVALALAQENPKRPVTLVSKDINLRIKAAILGLHAEDYYNDRVLDNVEQLHTGHFQLPANFWDTHSKEISSWREDSHTFYKIAGPLVKQWYPNTCIYTPDEAPFEAIVRSLEKNHAIIEVATDFRHKNHSVWGISARNREQSFALNLLMDPNIDFVSLQGTAGTGKTLLTLAAALEQTIEKGLYKEIVVTRVTVPVGEDIGFLPGTEEEKMTPWMGALMDNLEVLAPAHESGQWGQAATQDLLRRWVKIRSLNFMRGRTFLNKFVIIDEAQNLTPKQMKTLITRAGPGTKVVCLGNVAQIDTPYLTETSSGLTFVVDRFKTWEHSGHITLRRGERSRLADQASDVL